MNQRAKSVVARLLMAFVLVSVGYALGKDAGRRSVRPRAEQAELDLPLDADVAAIVADRVVVYYFHGTIRCVTCNSIERMTRETLDAAFADELGEGRVVWRVENFQENESLAERYGVGSSTVVVVRFEGDREVGFERLDQVWEFVHEPVMFSDYIRIEVQRLLEEGGE